MPSPVPPSQFCNAIPASNADLCTKMSRLLNIPQLLCDLFSWMFSSSGAISEDFKTEVAATLIPTGTIMASTTLNMGSLYLRADGSAVSRTTYAPLFAQVGTRYGAGDGSTTFNLPNIGSRSLMGSGTGDGLTTRDINNPMVGEERHAQTEAELAAHTHSLRVNANDDAGASPGNSTPDDSANPVTGSLTTDTQSTGSGDPFNVVHPCFVVHFFIKI